MNFTQGATSSILGAEPYPLTTLRLTRLHLVVPTRCERTNIPGQCGIRRGRNDRRQT